MRHKMRGRQLGRNATHRRAMFRNMACSLITSFDVGDEPRSGAGKVAGRIITTVEKAKELRPVVEKLVTLAKKAQRIAEKASEFAVTASRGSAEWSQWRKSDRWQKWNQAIAPAVAMRRRAFAALRSREAVNILFSKIGPRYSDRPGGYTRVVRLAEFRLGDAGRKAIMEFVGERDRKRKERAVPVVQD